MKNVEYTDSINGKTYLVPEDKVMLMNVYKNRYAVAVSLSVLFRIWVGQVLLLVLFAFVIGAFMEYNYRQNFLGKLTIVPTEKKKDKLVNRQAMTMNSVLYIILSIALVFFAFKEIEGNSRYIALAFASASFFVGVSYVLELIKNKK